MPDATIPANELRRRLIRAGHSVPDDEEMTCATEVWPSPETIVTVAMNLDPTLLPAYRQRYFACYLKSEDDPFPALRDDLAFALPEMSREAATEGSADDGFLGGPFRWLVLRVKRFHTVLVWPACREPNPDGSFAQTDLLEGLPRLRELLGTESPGAVVLDLRRELDWRILWEVATKVSRSSTDFFVSDIDCHQVYHLHHHGKIVVSLPDVTARQEMIDALAVWSNLLEDCSAYVSDWDDDDDQA